MNQEDDGIFGADPKKENDKWEAGVDFIQSLNNRNFGYPKVQNYKTSKNIYAFAEDKLVTKTFTEMRCEMPGLPRSTFLMVFSPDGTKIASTHGNHNIYVSDVRSGKNIKTLVGHPRTPWCIAFHPTSNQIIASGCLGGQVRIWDLSGGSEVWTAENQTVIASIAFHPEDRLLVIASSNHLHFWDWSKPEPFASTATGTVKEKVRYVAFDRLGSKLVTGISNSAQTRWERVRAPVPAPPTLVTSSATLVTSSGATSVGTTTSTLPNLYRRRIISPRGNSVVSGAGAAGGATGGGAGVSEVNYIRYMNQLMTRSRFERDWPQLVVPRTTASTVTTTTNTTTSTQEEPQSLAREPLSSVPERERRITACYRNLVHEYEQLVHRYLQIYRPPIMIDRGTDPMEQPSSRNTVDNAVPSTSGTQTPRQPEVSRDEIVDLLVTSAPTLLHNLSQATTETSTSTTQPEQTTSTNTETTPSTSESRIRFRMYPSLSQRFESTTSSSPSRASAVTPAPFPSSAIPLLNPSDICNLRRANRNIRGVQTQTTEQETEPEDETTSNPQDVINYFNLKRRDSQTTGDQDSQPTPSTSSGLSTGISPNARKLIIFTDVKNKQKQNEEKASSKTTKPSVMVKIRCSLNVRKTEKSTDKKQETANATSQKSSTEEAKPTHKISVMLKSAEKVLSTFRNSLDDANTSSVDATVSNTSTDNTTPSMKTYFRINQLQPTSSSTSSTTTSTTSSETQFTDSITLQSSPTENTTDISNNTNGNNQNEVNDLITNLQSLSSTAVKLRIIAEKLKQHKENNNQQRFLPEKAKKHKENSNKPSTSTQNNESRQESEAGTSNNPTESSENNDTIRFLAEKLKKYEENSNKLRFLAEKLKKENDNNDKLRFLAKKHEENTNKLRILAEKLKKHKENSNTPSTSTQNDDSRQESDVGTSTNSTESSENNDTIRFLAEKLKKFEENSNKLRFLAEKLKKENDNNDQLRFLAKKHEENTNQLKVLAEKLKKHKENSNTPSTSTQNDDSRQESDAGTTNNPTESNDNNDSDSDSSSDSDNESKRKKHKGENKSETREESGSKTPDVSADIKLAKQMVDKIMLIFKTFSSSTLAGNTNNRSDDVKPGPSSSTDKSRKRPHGGSVTFKSKPIRRPMVGYIDTSSDSSSSGESPQKRFCKQPAQATNETAATSAETTATTEQPDSNNVQGSVSSENVLPDDNPTPTNITGSASPVIGSYSERRPWNYNRELELLVDLMNDSNDSSNDRNEIPLPAVISGRLCSVCGRIYETAVCNSIQCTRGTMSPATSLTGSEFFGSTSPSTPGSVRRRFFSHRLSAFYPTRVHNRTRLRTRAEHPSLMRSSSLGSNRNANNFALDELINFSERVLEDPQGEQESLPSYHPFDPPPELNTINPEHIGIGNMYSNIVQDLESSLNDVRNIRTNRRLGETSDMLSSFSERLESIMTQSNAILRNLSTSIETLQPPVVAEIASDTATSGNTRVPLIFSEFPHDRPTRTLPSPYFSTTSTLDPPPPSTTPPTPAIAITATSPNSNSTSITTDHTYPRSSTTTNMTPLMASLHLTVSHIQRQARLLRTQVESIERIDRAMVELAQLQLMRQMFADLNMFFAGIWSGGGGEQATTAEQGEQDGVESGRGIGEGGSGGVTASVGDSETSTTATTRPSTNPNTSTPSTVSNVRKMMAGTRISDHTLPSTSGSSSSGNNSSTNTASDGVATAPHTHTDQLHGGGVRTSGPARSRTRKLYPCIFFMQRHNRRQGSSIPPRRGLTRDRSTRRSMYRRVTTRSGGNRTHVDLSANRGGRGSLNLLSPDYLPTSLPSMSRRLEHFLMEHARYVGRCMEPNSTTNPSSPTPTPSPSTYSTEVGEQILMDRLEICRIRMNRIYGRAQFPPINTHHSAGSGELTSVTRDGAGRFSARHSLCVILDTLSRFMDVYDSGSVYISASFRGHMREVIDLSRLLSEILLLQIVDGIPPPTGMMLDPERESLSTRIDQMCSRMIQSRMSGQSHQLTRSLRLMRLTVRHATHALGQTYTQRRNAMLHNDGVRRHCVIMDEIYHCLRNLQRNRDSGATNPTVPTTIATGTTTNTTSDTPTTTATNTPTSAVSNTPVDTVSNTPTGTASSSSSLSTTTSGSCTTTVASTTVQCTSTSTTNTVSSSASTAVGEETVDLATMTTASLASERRLRRPSAWRTMSLGNGVVDAVAHSDSNRAADARVNYRNSAARTGRPSSEEYLNHLAQLWSNSSQSSNTSTSVPPESEDTHWLPLRRFRNIYDVASSSDENNDDPEAARRNNRSSLYRTNNVNLVPTTQINPTYDNVHGTWNIPIVQLNDIPVTSTDSPQPPSPLPPPPTTQSPTSSFQYSHYHYHPPIPTQRNPWLLRSRYGTRERLHERRERLHERLDELRAAGTLVSNSGGGGNSGVGGGGGGGGGGNSGGGGNGGGHSGYGIFRPRFLHPIYSGVNPFDDLDEQRNNEQPYDTDIVATASPNHRIQVWKFNKSGFLPNITDALKNVVVGECKIHNDASVDIASNGSILVTLLPSGTYLNITNRLGVYSLDWETLGQCLYITNFEQNAVSVSLSPLSRHLVVGLASRRVSIMANEQWTLARIFLLDDRRVTFGRLSLVKEIEQNRDTNFIMSVNCIRWLPTSGQGLVFATNTGQLRILT